MGLRHIAVVAITSLIACSSAHALEADLKARIDAKLPAIKSLAAESAIVEAVKQHNTAPSADAKAMTQDKWKGLSVLDPFLRSMTKNPAGAALKEKKDAAVTEAFVSGADGKKVAFLAKPTNWSHAGKGKHDQPMANEVWYGDIEVDESTGMQQVQIAVPVLESGKPIGSLVVGLAVSKL